MHSFLGPSIGIQSTSGHGLFSSGISCPYPADQGGFLLASSTLFLVSQSLVFEHSLCQMTFSPCKCVVIILTACLQIWIFLSNIRVICVCDISRQSFSCGHFADIVTWLKKLACSVFKSNLEQCFLCAGVIRELFQTPLSVSGHFLCISTKSSSRGSSKHCCFIIPRLRCGPGSATEWWRAREACRGESDLLAF